MIWPFKATPKYRLVATTDEETYNLEKWEGFLGYSFVARVKSQEEADKVIKNLERDTVYYREEKP